MLKVTVGPGFLKEKEYTIDVLLNEFLGLKYNLEYCNHHEYRIELENGNELIFRDHFFSKLDEREPFYIPDNLPGKISSQKNTISHNGGLEVIYGNDFFKIEEKKIESGLDIIASSFFMLSRWEELANPERDNFGRFPDAANISVKNGFAQRPVVNEYIDYLWDLLTHLGIKQKRKVREFTPYITHDIDDLYKYDSFGRFLKEAGKDILQRKSLKSFINTVQDYSGIIFQHRKDNYHTFEFLMDVSEKHNLKSSFYFIPGVPGEEDIRYSIYDKTIPGIMADISRRGHITGLHASFRSYNNPGHFAKEKLRLQDITRELNEGRQHYLRFENPLTWQLWEKNNLKTDSTMGFTNDCGFRSGVCYAYPVFDVVNRKRLNLYERPVIVMDTALRFKYPEIEDFASHFYSLLNIVKNYNGDFVLIWHNSNFNNFDWGPEWKMLYQELIAEVSEKQIEKI